MTRTALLFIFSFILLPCSSYGQNNIPKEIKNKYPFELFIVRSGTGETPEAASESARFEIAKFFESKISGATIVNQWAKSSRIKGKTSEQSFTELSNNIITSASREIPGIEIALVNFDKKSKIYEAWAVLEKNSYVKYLNRKISDIDERNNQRFSKINGDDLSNIRTFSNIISDLIIREKINQDLTVIGLPQAESKQKFLYMVMSSVDSLLSDALDVGLVVTSERTSDLLKSGLYKTVNDAGIRIKEYENLEKASIDSIDLIILAEHNATSRNSKIKTNNKEFSFFFADWILSVKAIDLKTSEVIDTIVLKDQTSGNSVEQAYERMNTKILQGQIPQISKWVYNVIFKPSEEK